MLCLRSVGGRDTHLWPARFRTSLQKGISLKLSCSGMYAGRLPTHARSTKGFFARQMEARYSSMKSEILYGAVSQR